MNNIVERIGSHARDIYHRLDISLLLFTFFFVCSFLIYLFAPSTYIWGYDVSCCILFVVSVIFFFYLNLKKKENYFDFDTIFLLSYFFVFFVYPVFLYPINPQYFVVFAYSFDIDVVSKSTGLALLGAESYMWGSFLYKPLIKKSIKNYRVQLPTVLLELFTISLYLAFIALGGLTFFNEVYGGENDGSGGGKITYYCYLLFTSMILTAMAIEFHKLLVINDKKIEWKYVHIPFFLMAVLFAVLLVLTGTRTVPLQIMITLIGLFSLCYYPVPLKWFIPLFLAGVALMFTISTTRAGGGSEINSGFDIFMDLIINNRNTFKAVEYVNDNGLSWGTTMLGYILKVFPYLQGVVVSLFHLNPDYMNSASLLTVETLGEGSSWGLGTNIIADLYIAFGFVGVIVGMSFLGYLIHKAEYLGKAGHVYYLILYAILLSLSVYTVRAEYFYSLVYIVWSFICINIYRHFLLKAHRT